MPSVIVFDTDAGPTALEMDPEDPTTLAERGTVSVLEFDEQDLQDIAEPAGDPTGVLALDPVQTDVWIGDPTPVTEVVEGLELPDAVVVDDDGTELLVVSPQGPPGARGADGDTKYDDMPDLTLIFENGLI